MLLSQQLREKRYAKVAKRVHDAIRMYPAPDLLANIVSRIHRFADRDIQAWRAQPPWLLLLLLKWTIMYGSLSRLILRRVTDTEVDKLVNLMHGVDNASNQPKEHDHLWLFFRAIAYQQFFFQDPITLPAIARQALLFRGLPTVHRFRKDFLAAKQVDLDDWIDLSFMLASAFLSSPRVAVRDSYFDLVRKGYSSSTTRAFFGSFSRTLPELRQFLQSVTVHKTLEFRERSPLLTFPLLRRQEDFLCFSPHILLKSIEDNVYDTLRALDPERFMKYFGPLFEGYVRQCLDYLGQPFVDEAYLQATFGSGKVTDFALIRDENLVLIDAKGVDIGAQGMSSPSASTVVNRTRTSIVKALLQGEECGRRIIKQLGARELFLLVVSYKQLYFGNGDDFVRAVGGPLLSKEGYNPATATLRPENVYFVAVDELEHLVSALQQDGVALSEFLARTRDLDADPQTKSFVMKMHLFKRHPSPTTPPYLQQAFDAIMERTKHALDEGA